MKKIGLIDYYVDEWHAHHAFETVKACNEKNGSEYAITAVWAEKDNENGMTTDEFCAKHADEENVGCRWLLEDVSYEIMRIATLKELVKS